MSSLISGHEISLVKLSGQLFESFRKGLQIEQLVNEQLVCGVKVCWMSSRVYGGMSSRVCGDTVNITLAPGPDPLILN